MSNAEDKQPIKKRSLSSYLSNVSSRKEELIKIAQDEKDRIAEEKERLQKEKEEQERLEKERLQKEKEEKERLEQERLENEKLEQERLENEKLEQERLQKEKLEQERLQNEKLEQERLEKEKLEEERLQKEKLEQERLEKEKLEQKRVEKERIEKEEQERDVQLKREELANSEEQSRNDAPEIKNESPERTTSPPIIRSESISHEIHRIEKRNTNHLIHDDDDDDDDEDDDEEDEIEEEINPRAETSQLLDARSHDPFSRDTLKSMLREPHNRFLDDDAQSLRSLSNRSEVEKNTVEQYKEIGSDIPEQYKEIGSDEETQEGSPLKVRRSALLPPQGQGQGDSRGRAAPPPPPRLHPDILAQTADSDSDSDLSNIEDDVRNVDISSSFLHGPSSPTRPERAERIPSSPQHSEKPVTRPKTKNKNKTKSKSKRSLYRDSGGRTRLQIACDKGKLDTVRALLAAGEIDVNDQDNAGNTPLHEAALNGHLDIVQTLVAHGADPNVRSYEMFGDTPLIDASANGHLEVVSFLLGHGADPTVTNAKGMTAYEAIEDDSELDESERELVGKIRGVLREAAAGEQCRGQSPDKSGEASPSHSPQRETSSLPFYWNDISTSAGSAKLLQAAKSGDLAYVGQYLENGGKAEFRAFFEAAKLGHAELANLFLAFGASVNSTVRDGITPLMTAVGRAHLPTVRLLLGAGADVRARDNSGHDALYYAQHPVLGRENAEEVALLREKLGPEAKPRGRAPSHGEGEESPVASGKNEESPVSNTKNEERSFAPGKRSREVSQDESSEDELPRMHSHKRSRQGTPLVVENDESEASGAESESEKQESPVEQSAQVIVPEKVEVHHETPEERALRLKAEEEYRQRKIHNKKLKEQELLRKMQDDQRKREEERQRQRDEQQQLVDAQKQQQEVERRKAIRAQYPLGLRILTGAQRTAQSPTQLPLFYTQKQNSDSRYVLDLQLVAMGIECESNGTPSLAVSPQEKEQLWNLAKFAFLHGCDASVAQQFAQCEPQQRLAFERAEYAKFAQMPMHWVVVEDELARNTPMQRIAAAENSAPVSNALAPTAVSTASPVTLPFRLQHRHAVASWLRNGARPSRDIRAPLW